MRREDHLLLAELKRITEEIVRLIATVIDADPVFADAQRDLGERLLRAGLHLSDRAESGEPIHGYVDGVVQPAVILLKAPSHD